MNLKIKGSIPFQNPIKTKYLYKNKLSLNNLNFLKKSEKFFDKIEFKTELLKNKTLIVSKSKKKIKKIINRVVIVKKGLNFQHFYYDFLKKSIIDSKDVLWSFRIYFLRKFSKIKFSNEINNYSYIIFFKKIINFRLNIIKQDKLCLVFRIKKKQTHFNMFDFKKPTIIHSSLYKFVRDFLYI